MFVFLAVVAVIGGWGSNKRIQDRIEARARVVTPAVAVDRTIPPPVIEVVAPKSVSPATINAIERSVSRGGAYQ